MSAKRQTMFLTGVALLVIAGILLYVGISQPRVYETEENTKDIEVVYQEEGEQEATTKRAFSQKETTSDKEAEDTTTVKYPLNINTATFDELKTIDGLGDARAGDIIEYRKIIGGYKSVSQIMDIKGIDEAIYEKVAGYLTV